MYLYTASQCLQQTSSLFSSKWSHAKLRLDLFLFTLDMAAAMTAERGQLSNVISVFS